MKKWTLVILAAALAGSGALVYSGAPVAAKARPATPALVSCAKFTGNYPVRYLGGAMGRGELKVDLAAGREDAIQARMTLWDDTGTGAVIELAGPGSCDDGTLRVRFGGGDHPKALIKVLGGSLVAVPQPQLFEGMFAAWEATVLTKATNKERTIKGFLRQEPRQESKTGAGEAKHGAPSE